MPLSTPTLYPLINRSSYPLNLDPAPPHMTHSQFAASHHVTCSLDSKQKIIYVNQPAHLNPHSSHLSIRFPLSLLHLHRYRHIHLLQSRPVHVTSNLTLDRLCSVQVCRATHRRQTARETITKYAGTDVTKINALSFRRPVC